MIKHDVICISDLHLGSKICNKKKILFFLNEIKCNHLILNGDILDSNYPKLGKTEWEILFKLKELSLQTQVIWIQGNHDAKAKSIAEMLTVRYENKIILSDILFLHGHQWDNFINEWKFITYLSDKIYYFLQYVDKTHVVAHKLKLIAKHITKSSKTIKESGPHYLSCLPHVKHFCCGHTHHPEAEPPYWNCGCWTERTCHYLAVDGETIKLHSY